MSSETATAKGRGGLTRLLPAGGSSEVAYFVSKIVPGAVVFLCVGALVRILGEYQYGVASLYLGAALIAASALAGWLGQAQLRAAGLHRMLDVPRWVYVITIVSAAPITLVVGTAFLDVEVGGPTLFAAAVLGVAAVAQSLTLFDVQAAGFSREYARLETLRALSGAAVAIGLALVFRQAWTVLAGYAVGYVAAIVPLRSARSRQRRALSRDELRQWWSFGWPMGLWLLSSTLLSLAGRFVVAAMHGPDLAGYFSALYDIVVRGAAVLLFPLILAAHPRIMSAWNDGHRDDAVRGCRTLFRRLALLSGIIFLGGAAISPWVPAIVGVGPRPYAVPTVLLLLATALLWQLALAAHKPLELLHRTRWMLAGLVTAVTVNIVLLVLLVPAGGAFGAAIASFVGAGTYLVTCAPAWRAAHIEESSR